MAPETRNIQNFSDKLTSEPNKYEIRDVGGGNEENKEIEFIGSVTQAGTKNKAEYFNNIQKNGLYKIQGIRAIEGLDEKYDIAITGSSSVTVFEYQFILIPDVTNTNSGSNVLLRFNAVEYTIKIEGDGVERDVIAGDLVANSQYIGYLDHANGKFLLKKFQENRTTFDTIAQLQTATWLLEDDVVKIKGYRNKEDGLTHHRFLATADDGTGVVVGALWANLSRYFASNFQNKNITPLAPIHIGENSDTSDDPQVLVSRSMSGAGNSHCFVDASTFNKNAATAYNSYDCRVKVQGSNNLDHYAGFQFIPQYQNSGIMTHLYGAFLKALIEGGTVTNSYGVYIGDPPVSGGGAITNNYGIYIENMDNGTNDFAIYTGKGRHRFGDEIEVDRNIPGAVEDIVKLGATSAVDETTAYATLGKKGGTKIFKIGIGSAVEGLAELAADFLPSSSSAYDLGASGQEWKDIYLTNSPIVSSDERAKEQIEELDEIEKRVALKCKGLIRKYKLKRAVAEKGEGARTHIGIIAQEVDKAFSEEGLNAFDYGILCFDEWDEIIDKEGTVLKEAGEAYKIRYEELLCFIIAAI